MTAYRLAAVLALPLSTSALAATWYQLSGTPDGRYTCQPAPTAKGVQLTPDVLVNRAKICKVDADMPEDHAVTLICADQDRGVFRLAFVEGYNECHKLGAWLVQQRAAGVGRR